MTKPRPNERKDDDLSDEDLSEDELRELELYLDSIDAQTALDSDARASDASITPPKSLPKELPASPQLWMTHFLPGYLPPPR
jgi:hypothetical protein